MSARSPTPSSKKLNIWKWLSFVVLLMLALGAGLGFSFYRSSYGPSPSFRINHAEGLDIQSVDVNGIRASSVVMPDHLFVSHNVRPADPVSLHVVLTDGREFGVNFTEMGRATRVVELNDSNLVAGMNGRMRFTFDSEKVAIWRFSYERPFTRANCESPIECALPPGEHEIRLEFERFGNPGGGQVESASGSVKIVSGETVELTLDDFLEQDASE